MSTLTIRMPDATHARLRDLARARGVSINKLIEEIATATLSAHDAEGRFRLLARRGQRPEGLGGDEAIIPVATTEDAEEVEAAAQGLLSS